MQPVRLFFIHKTATRSFASIFINKDTNDREFTTYSKKGEKARIIFEDILNFDEVHVYINLAKADIVEKLDTMQRVADEFEEDRDDLDVLAIAIITIGYFFNPSTNPLHMNKAKK